MVYELFLLMFLRTSPVILREIKRNENWCGQLFYRTLAPICRKKGNQNNIYQALGTFRIKEAKKV